MTGTSLFVPIVKLRAAEVPPPPPGTLPGVKTVTLGLPTFAMSAALIVARNCVLLTKVVARSAPFHRTLEPVWNGTWGPTKPDPFTVRVNWAPPLAAEAGLRLPSTGSGLAAGGGGGGGTGANIMNVLAAEVPPPGVGLNTVMLRGPATARSPAGMAARSWVLLT